MADSYLRVDYYNLCTVPLFPHFNDCALAAATGFWYQKDGQFYLATNWHVVSGRNTYTGQPMNDQGAVPNIIQSHLQRPTVGLVTPRASIELYDGDGRALWWQHQLGQDVDVAVIPVECEGETNFVPYPVNDQEDEPELLFDVGIDVFVVGYPLPLQHSYYLPIWKRASIASTPTLAFDGLPIFLVDTLSREGMSGSPVLIRSVGGVA
jgi:hypothetical protein